MTRIYKNLKIDLLISYLSLLKNKVKRKVNLEGEELDEYYREQLEKEKEKIDKLKKSAELE